MPTSTVIDIIEEWVAAPASFCVFFSVFESFKSESVETPLFCLVRTRLT